MARKINPKIIDILEKMSRGYELKRGRVEQRYEHFLTGQFTFAVTPQTFALLNRLELIEYDTADGFGREKYILTDAGRAALAKEEGK
jgi:hypothetical protein